MRGCGPFRKSARPWETVCRIAIEGHSRWDINCAIRIARALEPYDVVWMEDIIQPDSAGDLARLVRETRVPQAVSERRITRFAYRELLERERRSYRHAGHRLDRGITEAQKIAALADTYHLAVTPHDCTGPVNLLASLHLCAAVSNVMTQETVRGFYEGYYLDILTRPLPIRDGRATFELGARPGGSATAGIAGTSRSRSADLGRNDPSAVRT